MVQAWSANDRQLKLLLAVAEEGSGWETDGWLFEALGGSGGVGSWQGWVLHGK